MNSICTTPQNIVLIGDAYVSSEAMFNAIKNSSICIGNITYLIWGSDDKEEFSLRRMKVERFGPESIEYAKGLDEAITDANIVITHYCPIPRSIIEKAKNLKYILTCRGGLEHIDLKSASEYNIPVFNVIRNAEPVADFTIGLMYALTRNIALSNNCLKNNYWRTSFYNYNFVKPLSSYIVGLAGLGNIGLLVAEKLKALKIKTIAYDKYVSIDKLKKLGLDDIELVESLEELFEKSDILSLHMRLTKETEKIIGKNYFSLMKDNAYFINTSRSGLINESEFIECLEKGKPFGAAIDVFEKEPLPNNHPFISMENVIITPHIAGMTVDAIPKAPYLLISEFEKYLNTGIVDRIVNYSDITLK